VDNPLKTLLITLCLLNDLSCIYIEALKKYNILSKNIPPKNTTTQRLIPLLSTVFLAYLK
jgi:hypothetical protein